MGVRRLANRGSALTRDEIIFLKKKYAKRGLDGYEIEETIEKVKSQLRSVLKQAREQGKSKIEQNLIFAQEFEKILMDAEMGRFG